MSSMGQDTSSQDLVVRRAQAGDAKRVADFVNRALQRRVDVQPRMVMSRLGEVGFLVAEEDDVLLGLIGWHVENLVACVTDLLIWPAAERERIGRALFKEMEAQATMLQAEAAILFLPPSRFTELMAFCGAFGYVLHTVGELPRAWREMAHEAGREDEDNMPVKQLRSARVFRPL
jgi:N-acetylglutamate synthase-like GNAT family acetyltransferase